MPNKRRVMTNVAEGIADPSKIERWEPERMLNNKNVRHLIRLLTDIAPSGRYIMGVIGPDDGVYSDDHRLEKHINN